MEQIRTPVVKLGYVTYFYSSAYKKALVDILSAYLLLLLRPLFLREDPECWVAALLQ
jgi:hypothetical protein